jgi:hypothetical protein
MDVPARATIGLTMDVAERPSGDDPPERCDAQDDEKRPAHALGASFDGRRQHQTEERRGNRTKSERHRVAEREPDGGLDDTPMRPAGLPIDCQRRNCHQVIGAEAMQETKTESRRRERQERHRSAF